MKKINKQVANMCGICGVVSKNTERVSIEEMTQTLKHRGPDDFGIYQDDQAALGHRRLSIIDLEGGKQPIFNEDNSKCIVFNGEIYNYESLRDTLLKKGHIFRTKSDTETILHAYEEWGESCVERLRGMFAFAVWDSERKKLFLARDRVGIKPLFYCHYKDKLYFASEMKAILQDRSVPRKMDITALNYYFTLSYIPAPHTIYANIKKLLPGHTLSFENGNLSRHKYWELNYIADHSKNEKFFINRFMELLQESVDIRLMSEVPLGAFLSGGIDSSTVVALMSEAASDPVNTFCIGFGGNVGGYLDERKYARMVSRRYSSHHQDYEVIPEPDGLIDKIVNAFDEPFADDSTIPSYYVCKVARQNVKVALSGLGGDEVFAGYERYLGFKLRNIYNRIPGFFRNSLIPKAINMLPERTDGHYTINHMKRFVRSASLPPGLCYLGYLSILSDDLKETLFNGNRVADFNSPEKNEILKSFHSSHVGDEEDSINRVLYCDIKTYLADDILTVTDRMSMHHSLEVRVPFVDHEFLEFCATIPPHMQMKWFQKKYLLKKAVRPLLPEKVISHRKQGFVGPMAQWLKKDLKTYTLDTLSESNMAKHNMLSFSAVESILEDHFSGKEIHDTLIWSMLVFQKWYDNYMEM